MQQEDLNSNNSSSNEEEKEITYNEILSSAILNSEVIITVLPEDVERTKTGLKNLKAKQAQQLKEDGLPIPPEVLVFEESESKEYEGFTDLRVILKVRGSVKIKNLKLPDNTF